MKKVICCILFSLTIFVGTSLGQEPKQSVIFDVSIIGLDPGNAAGVESLMKDKTGLDRLIADGKARLEASLHLRSRINEQASVRIGARVPLQSGSTAGVAQIQYENTGLNLDVTPTGVMGDQIGVKFKLELTGADHSTGILTPSFVNRTLADVVQVRSGEPSVLVGVAQPEQRTPAAPGAAGPSQSSFAVVLTARLSN